VTGGQQPQHRGPLLRGQLVAGGDLVDVQRRAGGLLGEAGGALAVAGAGLLHDGLLGGQDVDGGVAGGGRHHVGAARRQRLRVAGHGEHRVGELVQAAGGRVDAGRERVREFGEQLRAGELLLVRGQPGLRVEHHGRQVAGRGDARAIAGAVDALAAVRAVRPGSRRGEHRVDVHQVLGPLPPRRAQVGAGRLVLGVPGGLAHAGLVRPVGVRAGLGVDLGRPPAEGGAQLLGHADDLPRAGPSVLLEPHPEPLAKQRAHARLEQPVERASVAVQVLAGVRDAAPLPVLAQREVGHHDVDV
jgi:hypothetical protein